MCGRFDIRTTRAEISRRFGVEDGLDALDPLVFARGEVRPTNNALVITAGPRAGTRVWGLAAGRGDGKILINARAETLETRTTFRPLLARRCLVPANAYFEWRREGRRKLRNRIGVRADGGSALFAFAGIADGARFAIITCPPAPEIAHIHDRMPVILDAADEAPWLDATVPFAAAKRLLGPFAGARLAVEEESAPPRGRRPGLCA
ncbi:MAG: SOS response-associated peptidase [Proteobacteria bacterium]|nr:SOS response-associated peptidase [Pseudomonadota bacterium]